MGARRWELRRSGYRGGHTARRCLRSDGAADQPKSAPQHGELGPSRSDRSLGPHADWTHPYIGEFGWEVDLLRPVPRTRPWQEPEYGGLNVESHDPSGDSAPPSEYPAWMHLVEGIAEAHGARLAEMLLNRRSCIYRFALAGSGVDVVHEPLDPQRPALRRSASFNVLYRNVRGDAYGCLVAAGPRRRGMYPAT